MTVTMVQKRYKCDDCIKKAQEKAKKDRGNIDIIKQLNIGINTPMVCPNSSTYTIATRVSSCWKVFQKDPTSRQLLPIEQGELESKFQMIEYHVFEKQDEIKEEIMFLFELVDFNELVSNKCVRLYYTDKNTDKKKKQKQKQTIVFVEYPLNVLTRYFPLDKSDYSMRLSFMIPKIASIEEVKRIIYEKYY